MKRFHLSDIIEGTRGLLRSGKRAESFSGISIDSRKIKSNELFIAIKGEKFDGHSFIFGSLKRGAKGVIYSEKKNVEELIESFPKSVFIEVNDTLKALQDIALFYRRKFSVPLIGITGSNGKTTVKEMADTILSRKFKTIKNPGNLNNHIGLPLSLLHLDKRHQIGVFELGMSRAGEIKALCKIAAPTVGVVTNVGLAHAKNFRGIRDIAKAKAELIYSLPDSGVAIINGDDQNLVNVVRRFRGRKIFFGKGLDNDVRADEIDERGLGIDFILCIGRKRQRISLPVIGEHNVYNALAASACSYHFGVTQEEIKKGLESYKGVHLRLEVIKTQGGVNILNDSYNANPSSMTKALESFSKISAKGKKILLLGDMLELGKIALKCHTEIGAIVAKGNYDFLFTVGRLAKNIALSSVKEGMQKGKVKSFKNSEEVIKPLKKLLSRGDWIFVKGSRGMKLDEIVNEIIR